MRKYNLDDTIAAISTPVGEGGIGIVRLSGKKALSIADKIFLSKDGIKPSQFKTYTTHYGHIIDCRASCVVRRASKNKHTTHNTKRNTQIIDEVILTVMRAPKSYTKEDIAEINCHGGIVPLRRVLDLVVSLRARIAEPGEFTKRAFLNGRIDLIQAEAILDVIRSKTDAALNAALNQLEGELSKEIKNIKNEIMDFYIHIETAIDFPEEDVKLFDALELSKRMESVSRNLKALIETSDKGKVLREGISATICGKQNVGKSTLMNALLKEKRVIVTSIPGTTRDVIEEIVNIDGIPLKIADTAGLIEPSNLIDRESIEKTEKHIKAADLVLLLFDNSQNFTEEDAAVLNMAEGKKAIIVINKIDLPRKLNLDSIKKRLNGKKIVEISAAKGSRLGVLLGEISDMVWSGDVSSGHDAIITNVRHANALKKAHKSLQKANGSLKNSLSPELIAIDIKETLDALAEITGEVIGEDLLNKIFSEFCIGK